MARQSTKHFVAVVLAAVIAFFATAAGTEIPSVHSNIYSNSDGKLFYISPDGDTLWSYDEESTYTLDKLRCNPEGTEDGVRFDFQIPDMSGKLYYGFIPGLDEAKYSYPVYFNRSAKIDSGVAVIDIRNKMVGRYDYVNWQETGVIRLGYRVVNSEGRMLYDGKVMLRGKGPFEVDTSIIEGPFVNMITHRSVVISFETNFATQCRVIVSENAFPDMQAGTHHEIVITGLTPDTEYDYTVVYGNHRDTYSFRTAPEPGSRLAFMFAYASDGRANNGGGERSIKGVNAYMMKKIAALCAYTNARFLQFTGDLINGYSHDRDEMMLEYANWKRAVEPFACYFPFVAGFGNHENLEYYFKGSNSSAGIDRFPFDTESSEAVFAQCFVNPKNGPGSEDGSAYDPNPDKIDFPSYSENAFYYTYDNVAVISLNSNYWYSWTVEWWPEIGGNLHGYIMDNQLEWLKATVEMFENDEDIDHVFVTQHTPVFPNGGHVGDDMWYNGNNEPRPSIAGKLVDKGIIERRDEMLDILMNRSSKVIAVLTGDEHNYNRLLLTEDMPIYPDDWDGERLTEFRPIWMINNGAAGAPYYGQEDTPWMSHLQKFSTQNALVLFHVDGRDIRVEVVNPDTLEKIDEFVL